MQNNYKNIIVVDDSPTNCQILEDLLTQHGYKVSTFIDAKSALQYCKEEKPSLFILDVNMPEIDGFSLCHQLKCDENFCDIPVLFISAITSADEKIKGFETGAADYITKPFHEAEVIARIRTNLNLYKSQMELKRYNNELQFMVEEKTKEILLVQEKMQKLKLEFISNISHEMRTPLNAIIGIMQLISMQSSSELDESIIAEGKNAAYNLLRMVNNVIEYGQADDLDCECVLLNWVEITEATVEHVLPIIQEKGLKIRCKLEKNLPKQVHGFLTRIRKVIDLLIDNAIKFTNAGEIEFSISFIEANNEIIFRIADTGIGIAKNFQSELFSLFTQGDGSSTRPYGGTGLGLALCKKLVNSWQGEIWLDDKYVIGSTTGAVFAFSIPINAEQSCSTIVC